MLIFLAESEYDLEYRGLACDGQRAIYNCPTGYYVKVMAASYGRSDNASCTGNVPEGKDTNSTCDMAGALDIMQQTCDGKQRCEFVVNSDLFNTTECQDVHSYLDIVFICERTVKFLK